MTYSFGLDEDLVGNTIVKNIGDNGIHSDISFAVVDAQETINCYAKINASCTDLRNSTILLLFNSNEETYHNRPGLGSE